MITENSTSRQSSNPKRNQPPKLLLLHLPNHQKLTQTQPQEAYTTVLITRAPLPHPKIALPSDYY